MARSDESRAGQTAMNPSNFSGALVAPPPSTPVLTSPVPTPETVNTTAFSRLVDDLVAVLDEGPVAFDPNVAMTLAIATPLALLAMCVMCLVCRGVPYVMCGGKCTYWRRMPKEPIGLEPDSGIGEHQDEHCDVDSVDEEPRTKQQYLDEDDMQDIELAEHEIPNGVGQRECCSKMAEVLEAGGLVGADRGPPSPTSAPSGTDAAPTSPPSARAGANQSRTKNGKQKMVSIVAPE